MKMKKKKERAKKAKKERRARERDDVAMGDAAFFAHDSDRGSSKSSNRSKKSRRAESGKEAVPSDLFKINAKLGKGSYGSVYKAVYLPTAETVALKIVDDIAAGAEELSQINKEISLMSKLNDASVVKFIGSFADAQRKQLWIAMEFMDAGSALDTMRHLKRGFEEPAIRQVVKEVLTGLEYLHAAGVIHRDIKAANILMATNGSVKIGDLGISATVTGTLKSTGTQVGSPFWMAPEVIKEIPYSNKVDIWAIGITAIELAEMNPPLFKVGPIRSLFMIANKPPPTLTEPDHYSDDFSDFLRCALIKKFDERPEATQLLTHSFVTGAPGTDCLIDVCEQLFLADSNSESRSSHGGSLGADKFPNLAKGGSGTFSGDSSGLTSYGSMSRSELSSTSAKTDRRPRLVGQATEGETIEMALGRSATSNVDDYQFAWFRRKRNKRSNKKSKWVVIDDEVGASHTLVRDDINCNIKCVASVGVDSGSMSTSSAAYGGTLLSASTDLVRAALPTVRKLRVRGAPYWVNQMTAVFDYIGGRQGNTKIEWQIETKPGSGNFDAIPSKQISDDQTLKCTRAMQGCCLKVTVTPVRSDNKIGKAVSVTTEPLRDAAGRILIYSSDGCSHCVRAKQLLKECGAPVAEINLTTYPFRRDEMKTLTNGKRGVPQIFFNETHIGGASQIDALKRDGKLESLIQETLAQPAPSHPTVPQEMDEFGLDTYITPDEQPFVLLCRRARHPLNGMQGVKKRGPITSKVLCFKGKDLIAWLNSQPDIGPAKAVQMAAGLQEFGYISALKRNNQLFRPDDTLFQWSADLESYCLNMKRIWKLSTRAATDIAFDMQKMMLAMADKYINEGGNEVNYSAIAASDELLALEHAAIQLQTVKLDPLSPTELKCFFINLYNTMVIHATTVFGAPQSAMQRSRFFGGVCYNIGGQFFTLNSIEHGIIRCNRKPPGALRKILSDSDPRSKYILRAFDPRIHFALNCGAKSCPAIRVYDTGNLEEALTWAAESFLSEEIEVDTSKRIVTLSMLLKWYKGDFPSGSNLLAYISQFVSGQLKNDLDFLASTGQNVKFKYRKYDWGSNLAQKAMDAQESDDEDE